MEDFDTSFLCLMRCVYDRRELIKIPSFTIILIRPLWSEVVTDCALRGWREND
jgi:hypothetical protein